MYYLHMQKGFIALPILALIVLGVTVVIGGGYAAYKINDLENKNEQITSEINSVNDDDGVSTTTRQESGNVTNETPEETKQEITIIDSPTENEQGQKNYNYVVIKTLENNIASSKKLLTVFPPIYALLDDERQRFVAIRSQTKVNLSAAGMSEVEVSNQTIIRLYDEYISWLGNTKNLYETHEQNLRSYINGFESLKTKAGGETMSYEDAVAFVQTDISGQMVSGISGDVRLSYEGTKSFMNEFHSSLWTLADTNSKASAPTIKPLQLPSISNTHCTVSYGNISCSSVSY